MNSSAVAGPDPDLWLSTQVRVRQYLTMEMARDTVGIARFLRNRFSERYIIPLKNVRAGDENGFMTMGVCCLMIEGVTAFREGWPTTKNRSLEAFQLFFGKEARFVAFRGPLVEDFYKGVRCGILHQGETSRGWRLNFTNAQAPLFDAPNKRINCNLFLSELEAVLQEYHDDLLRSGWDDAIWVNLRSKMKQTIEDCKS
jgi:hypothetical protein